MRKTFNVNETRTAQDWTKKFCIQIENPANASVKAKNRADMVIKNGYDKLGL